MSPSEITLIVFGFLLFTAIGSFTCVIIDRLPFALDEANEYGELWDTRPWAFVLRGRSRCSTCLTPVRPYDNIPVLSWLILRGRCRNCSESIPIYHLMVELIVPLLFLGALWSVGFSVRLLPILWLIPVGTAVSVIDFQTFMVPTRIVWPAFFVMVGLTALSAGLEGEWGWILSALIGLVTLAGPLFVTWFIIPKGMGFGDVRLATLLGWTVGFYSGTQLGAGAVLTLICLFISSAIGLVIGIVGLGARGRKAKVPFGPALLIGAYISILLAPQILEPFGIYALTR